MGTGKDDSGVTSIESLRSKLKPDASGRLGTSDIGKVTVRGYRVGSTEDKYGRGVFYAGEREGAEAYSVFHPGEEVQEQNITLNNVLLAGHQSDVTRKLFGKPYGELMDEFGRKYGKQGGAVVAGKFDVKIAKEAKKRGYDGIIYVKPAYPAKSEIAVLSSPKKKGKKRLLDQFIQTKSLSPPNVESYFGVCERIPAGQENAGACLPSGEVGKEKPKKGESPSLADWVVSAYKPKTYIGDKVVTVYRGSSGLRGKHVFVTTDKDFASEFGDVVEYQIKPGTEFWPDPERYSEPPHSSGFPYSAVVNFQDLSQSPNESKPLEKKRAEKGKLVSARREGKGKEAKVILHGGKPAPDHIKPAMIPPAWKKVRISLNPDADVWATAEDTKGRKKTVYNPKFENHNASAKFSKIVEMLTKRDEIANQIQQDRKLDNAREEADVAWLMMKQGTRPGNEADNKGFAELYGKKLTPDDFKVIRDKKKKDGFSVTLELEGQEIPFRDLGTKEEIVRRMENGESLEDSDYWLKSFGASTLEARHIVETPDGVRVRFQGKESVWHDHLIVNPKLAEMLVDRAMAAEGPKGKLFKTDYNKVAKYVGKLDGGKYTPKDLRTARGTSLAIKEIKERGECCDSPEQYQEVVMDIATKVSKVLGNDPEMALTKYIAPQIWSAFKNPEQETNA